MAVQIDIDREADVLFAQRADARVARHADAAIDSFMVLLLDDQGAVVGVQLLAASAITWGLWREHPDRAQIPDEIVNALDTWFRLQEGSES